MAISITQAGALVQVNTVLQLNAYLYCGPLAQLGIFTTHFFVNATPSGGATLGDVAKAYQTVIDADLQALTTIETQILGAKAIDLTTKPYPLPGIASSTSIGSLPNPTLPGQVSGITSWLTQRSGRGYRGRIYVPFPGVDAVQSGTEPTGAYITNLTTLSNDIFGISAFTDGIFNVPVLFVLRHKKSGGFDAITGLQVRKAWATQRKRGDYGRVNSPVIS